MPLEGQDSVAFDRTRVMVFGVMGGLVAAYVLWLVVRGPQPPQSGWINGWAEDAFYLAAGVVCVIGGLRRRPGSYVPLVFGLALIFTMIGNTILTVDALHGIPPPPPTPADFFGLGFIVLCFAGIGLMAREDRERLSPRELLDGGIAALGAAAVCAAFVLAHLPHRPGQSTFGSALQLAYPIGYVVLVLIVVGAATVASKRSPAPWVALTAAFALLALGSALAAAAGPSRLEAIKIVTLAVWPAATLLVAASMWADPGVPDPLAARKGTVVWIPALACAAAIAVLFASTLTRVDHAATALATAALVLVMLRGTSELRQEIAAREGTEKSLRASEAGYRRVADEQAALRRVATLVARGTRPSEVFAAVTDEVGRVLGTDVTWLRRYLPGPAAASIAAFAAGERLSPEEPRPLGGHNIATLVHETGQPARVQGSDWLLRDWKGQVLPHHVRRRRACRGGREPVGGDGGRLVHQGAAASRHRGAPGRLHRAHRDGDRERGGARRAECIAGARGRQRRRDQAQDRARPARRRPAPARADESHAQAGPAIGNRGSEDVAELIKEAVVSTERAYDELRELARGLHPVILATNGLAPALKGIALRSPIPVVLDLRHMTGSPSASR